MIIDETFERWQVIHAAAGTPHDNFALTFADLHAITGGTVCDCVKGT